MFVPDRELIPLVRDALARGQCVRLTATGKSMTPFIYNGDIVDLEMIEELPRLGDIVQVQCAGEKCILHRVVRLQNKEFFLRGDAQASSEGPFTQPDLLGRVVQTYHNGHARAHNQGAWRFAGYVWMRCAPLYWLAIRIRGFVKAKLRLNANKHR